VPSQTFTIAAATDNEDIYTYSQQGVYPPTTHTTVETNVNTLITEKSYFPSFTEYDLEVTLLRWDTSTLPAGVHIDSANLLLYVTQINNSDSRNLTASYYSWSGQSNGDWTSGVDSGAITDTPLANFTVAAVNTLPLLNPGTNINRSGYTGIRLTMSGGKPSGKNEFYIASYSNANHPAAQLVVNYSTLTDPNFVGAIPL